MIPRQGLSRAALRVRFLWCVVAVGAACSVLLLRLAYLQVVQGSRYRYLSENNRIRAERVAAPRGMILDRNGEILADVRASFDATVIPAELPREGRDALFERVARELQLEPAAVAEVVAGRGPPGWKPRILKRRLTRTEMARLEGHRLELPGVVVHASPVRHYPWGSLLGTGLGYVGEVSGAELGQPAYAEYEAGDFIGRAGLEWAWEGELSGDAGGQQVEVDVRGRKLAVLASVPARPGHNVVLTIDRTLQQAAEAALGEEVGSVVALDVYTGDVLALVSLPSYEPGRLAVGLTPEEWTSLSTDPLHPLQSRAVQGVYPPGSTFKIATALAGLAEGTITPRSTVFCPGELQFAGRAYRCWKKTGHGEVDLEQALTQSCDVYFYQLGLDLGVDGIHRWAAQLGLGEPSGVDLPGESAGLNPSKSWKRRARREPWYPGETLSVAIGQGYVLATPLQLASMAATVAHPRGVRMRPRIVSRIEDSEGRPLREIPPQAVIQTEFRGAHLQAVRDALRQVVVAERGTGKQADVEGFPVAGKTGTAQVVKMPAGPGPEPEEVPWEYRDHALFVCYAPADDPRLAVAVVVEHGGHGGSAAAPVARQVVEAYRSLARAGVSSRMEQPR